jgi:hypothetical protein
MGRFKVNRVSVDIQNYLYYIRGIKKVGKTTLFRDLILELFDGNPEKGLLIACKDEVGYKALDSIQAEHVETFVDFEKLVNDLVKNKAEYGIEMICLDTADELVAMAIERAIKLSQLETGKVCKSINSAFSGYGAGRQRVSEIIKENLAKLRKAGYGIAILGHTKLRTIKEKGMTEDEGYQQLTSNLSADYDSIFADIFDVIATIDVDKEVVDGKLAGTKRYMYFRNDGYVDCGSRFKGMPDRILLDDDNLAKGFISAIREGIKNSMSTPMSDAEIEARRIEEVKERETKALAYTELPSNEEMIETIKAKFGSAVPDSQSAVVQYLSNNGVTSGFKDASVFTTEQLQDIIDILG